MHYHLLRLILNSGRRASR